jgi:hypothetical protein
MTAKREIKEGQQPQGVDESIIYTLTTTPWGSSPGTISVKVYSIASSGARTDVTSTVMPTGSASAVGDVITLPAMTALTAGTLYRVEVKFTCSGNVFEAYAYVKGEN